MRLIAAAIAAGLLWATAYAVACWVWPFVACPRCTGSGTHRSPSGRAWRDCRRCSGTGRRLRLGRRAANWAARRRA
ncbi:hypothetical protein NUM_51970 [Actinocatenispora comari]|uniref:Uncharacterized protein n=1 Tax=Actinocatenispora comari TaxID=2807577 RepID=A0A8J4AJK5_9ACTN|nr:hypothetical protein NUM_51970 [Actinocatenispora comari]